VIFRQIPIGGDRNFSYLIGNTSTRQGCIIDPAFNPALAMNYARESSLEISLLVNTHGHYDHSNGNDFILSNSNAEFIHGGRGGIAEGDVRSLGDIRLTFIHTPGHTSDSICILIEEDDEPSRLCTGDTLFVGKVGGTDFDTGARDEYNSLHQKIMIMPDETQVWPGHDYGVRPHSTIGHERKTNPFLLCTSFDAFVHLKKNWQQYKQEHGIT